MGEKLADSFEEWPLQLVFGRLKHLWKTEQRFIFATQRSNVSEKVMKIIEKGKNIWILFVGVCREEGGICLPHP